MTDARFTLSGKTVLVTGASSGLGEHFATVCAGAGAHVCLAARRADRLALLVARLAAQGHQASALSLDVTDESSIHSCLAAAGPVDVLINMPALPRPGMPSIRQRPISTG